MKHLLMAIVLGLLMMVGAEASICVDCHSDVTPNIVSDWKLSRHFENEIDCSACHGDGHTSAADVSEVNLPTPAVCATCHSTQVEQFSRGKHAAAWAATKAMPTIHALPMTLAGGLKSCGSCHKLGLKSEAEIAQLKADGTIYGNASCDACHSRHVFSKAEASQPQACQTCHMGFDHPQWEMYSSSKHGVRYLLKQNGTLPEDVSAPTCQTCHMQGGDHEVRTAWGFLAVRLPLPEDEQWRADQLTILQTLGVLDREGYPTSRLDLVESIDAARLTQDDFDIERDKMIETCGQCHSENFARAELAKGDDMIREADHLLAEAIREIISLYKDGLLTKPESYAFAFPVLSPIEQRLFEMHLKHRMRAFQGIFHANANYAYWDGWNEMVRDLSEIRLMAKELRGKHGG
ncbi:MAG: multiheme c-type cytochrome [bacterium]